MLRNYIFSGRVELWSPTNNILNFFALLSMHFCPLGLILPQLRMPGLTASCAQGGSAWGPPQHPEPGSCPNQSLGPILIYQTHSPQ